MKYARTLTAAAAATAILVSGCTTDESAADGGNQAATEAVDDGPPEITGTAIDATVDFFEEEPMIEDAAVVVDGDTVSIAMQVGAATDPEWAREQLDNATRFLAAQTASDHDDLAGPSSDHLGDLWDHYTLHVGAGTGPDDMMVQGAKVPTSPHITW